jgi:hypothetical protein
MLLARYFRTKVGGDSTSTWQWQLFGGMEASEPSERASERAVSSSRGSTHLEMAGNLLQEVV